MSAEPSTTPTSHCRWLQYSLRTMLVLMLVFGAGLGWFARQVHQARAQREAVKAIERLGGRAGYWAGSGGMKRMAWLGKLTGEDLFGNVEWVDFQNTQVTDSGLVHLRGLTQLDSLLLNSPQVTDGGLEHLRGLTELAWLRLDNTQVTDAGLANLRGLTKLKFLNLMNTQVTEAGVVELQKALPECDSLLSDAEPD